MTGVVPLNRQQTERNKTMNESITTSDSKAVREFRPQLHIFHANGRGTGCALKMELHPAHDDVDGCIMMSLANQKSVASTNGGVKTFATFDWEHKMTVKLDFTDICQMLTVFRGRSESIGDGKGLYHTSPAGSTKIVLRHLIEPHQVYSLEVYRDVRGKPDEQNSAHMLLSEAEADGIALAFENSIGIICFGIPKVIPHDTSSYRAQVRNMRNAAVA